MVSVTFLIRTQRQSISICLAPELVLGRNRGDEETAGLNSLDPIQS